MAKGKLVRVCILYIVAPLNVITGEVNTLRYSNTSVKTGAGIYPHSYYDKITQTYRPTYCSCSTGITLVITVRLKLVTRHCFSKVIWNLIDVIITAFFVGSRIKLTFTLKPKLVIYFVRTKLASFSLCLYLWHHLNDVMISM